MTFQTQYPELNAGLEEAVNKFFHDFWAAQGDEHPEQGVITDWVVVVAYQDFTGARVTSGINVEMRSGAMAYQVKGLLAEGIDWVVEKQEDDED